jgi:hypothetical protein
MEYDKNVSVKEPCRQFCLVYRNLTKLHDSVF